MTSQAQVKTRSLTCAWLVPRFAWLVLDLCLTCVYFAWLSLDLRLNCAWLALILLDLVLTSAWLESILPALGIPRYIHSMYTFEDRQIFFSASQSVSLTVPVKVLRLLFALHLECAQALPRLFMWGHAACGAVWASLQKTFGIISVQPPSSTPSVVFPHSLGHPIWTTSLECLPFGIISKALGTPSLGSFPKPLDLPLGIHPFDYML